jgi:hypothetical protein
MSQRVNIYVPCEVLKVKVRVGPHNALSPLEDLFLRAVHEGISAFHELADLFGIGHRPTLDLVFDLWQKGYLVLDLSQGAVHLDSHVSQLITSGELQKLAGAEETDDVIEIMFDRLTGHVHPVTSAVKRNLRIPGNSMVPAEYFDVSKRDVRTQDLLSTLRLMIDREEQRTGAGDDRPRRARKVLGAHLSLIHLEETSERRWLSLTAQCTADEGTGELSVQVFGDGKLSAAARAAAAERIARLAEDLPDSSFVSYLRGTANPGQPSLPDVDSMFSDLERITGLLVGVDADSRAEWQGKLEDIADVLEEEAVERRGTEVGLEVVVGHDRHSAVIADLIEKARRQVVIASPWVSHTALLPLLTPVVDALNRGVQVFLLWGIDPDQELEPPVRNFLLPLQEKYHHLFFVSIRSSRTHAKLVVQDDRRALVTSLNLLKPSRLEVFEVGVLLTAPNEKAPCPPVEGLLDWARSAYPEYLKAQLLYTSHDDFHRAREEEAVAETRLPRPALPDVDHSSGRDFAHELDAVAGRLWQLAWTDFCRAIRSRVTTPTPTARAVRNGQHRELLGRALRTARERLLITSDKVGSEVVDTTFLKRLEERLDAGVLVTLVYRDAGELVGADGTGPTQRLAALAARYPARMRCVPLVASHAKILVFDEVAVVSSFNFLSFEGYYDAKKASARRRQRSEVGIMLSGGGSADAVVAAVHARFADAFPPPPRVAPLALESDTVALPSTTVGEVQTLLASLAQAGDEADRADLIRGAVSDVADRWWLLGRLDEAKLPIPLLRLAAAAALVDPHRDRESEARAHWLRWLAEDAWSGRRFVEAAVLQAARPDLASARLPRHHVVLLAAGWSVGQPTRALVEASYRDDLTADERFTLGIACLTQVMLRGSIEALVQVSQI